MCFANRTDVGTFLVLEGPPAPVVVGLDMIRKWQLYHDPRTDQVFVLEATACVGAVGGVLQL